MTTGTLSVTFVTQTCCWEGCGVQFAMTRNFDHNRRQDHKTWYCPNGHGQSYTGDDDAEKLRKAEARELALKDQLAAAIRDAEHVRVVLVRDRHRFANGVCPCCNRSFENVRRHMVTKHPDYDVTKVVQPSTTKPFKCTCGQSFATPRGLAIHQGHRREVTGAWAWDNPKAPTWAKHLTVV